MGLGISYRNSEIYPSSYDAPLSPRLALQNALPLTRNQSHRSCTVEPVPPSHAYTNRKTHPPSPSRQYTPHRSRVTITNIGTTLEQYSPSLACLLPVHCVQQGTEEHSAIFLFTSSGIARVFAHALGWSSPPTQAQIESRSEIISPGFVKVETAKRPLGSLVSLSWGM